MNRNTTWFSPKPHILRPLKTQKPTAHLKMIVKHHDRCTRTTSNVIYNPSEQTFRI